MFGELEACGRGRGMGRGRRAAPGLPCCGGQDTGRYPRTGCCSVPIARPRWPFPVRAAGGKQRVVLKTWRQKARSGAADAGRLAAAFTESAQLRLCFLRAGEAEEGAGGGDTARS
eukprot:78376-Chlamydomonas_euryale.AAC.3